MENNKKLNTTILVNKPIGLTPLDSIKLFQQKNPEYQNVKIGYAGRLDPMAHGLLLLLVGDENKKRKDYEKLDKEYIFKVLFGIKTDTYDVLGIPENLEIKNSPADIKKKITKIIPTFLGKYLQPYPPYSSKPVLGKPLYYWAREGKISEIKIPKKRIEIFVLNFLELKNISIEKLEQDIKSKIAKVSGNFRQKDILARWEKVFETNSKIKIPLAKFQIKASSGTYVRSLANKIGEKLNTGAIAFDIMRTKIGNYEFFKNCLLT